MTTPLTARDALRSWFPQEGADLNLTTLTGGLINRSWQVQRGDAPLGVLQHVNGAVFAPTVNADLHVVSQHVARKGLLTPQLIATATGEHWLSQPDRSSWRLLTWVPGRTYARLSSPSRARAGAAFVARWHLAVDDLQAPLQHHRPGAHDTARHLAVARQAVADHADHPLHAAVAPLVDHLADRLDAITRLGTFDLPVRLIHGDLKVSNLRFDAQGRAIALLDLDTCAYDTLDVELGDLLRSWCASGDEDAESLTVDADRWSAALFGYAAGSAPSPPSPEAWGSLLPGALRITTELALRFAADALRESYFGWDPQRFERAGDHHLLRARGQASLSDDLWHHRLDLTRRLDAARHLKELP